MSLAEINRQHNFMDFIRILGLPNGVIVKHTACSLDTISPAIRRWLDTPKMRERSSGNIKLTDKKDITLFEGEYVELTYAGGFWHEFTSAPDPQLPVKIIKD